MKKINVGLNGFGRIGRAFTRIASSRSDISINVINTSKTTPEQLAYSLSYDSIYRTFNAEVVAEEKGISINGNHISSYNYKNPAEIPWGQHEVDVVIDCTGVFKTRTDLQQHLRDTVKKVILTVPTSDETIPHVVLGTNDDEFDFAGADILSNASCTTNCAALLFKVLDQYFGVEGGFLTTTHAYTSSQSLIDNPGKTFTRGRAAALSIIPTTTGASKAIAKVCPIGAERLSGFALRVPTATGSLSEVVCQTKKPATVEAVNNAFKQVSQEKLTSVLKYETAQLVSADYIGSSYSCIFDSNYTNVVNGNLVQVFGWYDNEWGYSSRVADLIERLGKELSS